MHDYPAEMPIRVLDRPLNHTVRVPGSKSITNRALIMAAMLSRTGSCKLTGALQSEDTEVLVDSLQKLGYKISATWPDILIGESGSTEIVPASTADLFVANSGTSMRFLAALCALGHGRYRLDGIARMRERPIRDLVKALSEIGTKIQYELCEGFPPIVIEANGLQGKGTFIRTDISSQFASALLMIAPFNDRVSFGFGIGLQGPVVSEPYIKMTEQMMLNWGSTWRYSDKDRIYTFDSDSEANYFSPSEYVIEPDATAASYFFAAAAIRGGFVTVDGMKRDMLQGDVRFVECLEMMGCDVEYLPDAIRISFDPLGRALTGIDVDMNAISDTVMTLAAVACFASSPTTIRNVAHIRHKETDRIAAIATELRKLGVEVEEYPDGLKITPRPMTGCALDTYNDHRMAMSLALIGLKVPGLVIRNPGCVAKTYPGFWQDFERLYDSAS